MSGTQIRQLSEHTINQIAAGEVIEDTTSVVKELIDNALDSGASEISIICEQGGRTLISVEDNGSGIPEDQISLAFTRHATSKLQEAHQLGEISSMGFRGEALASIASVSRIKILSSTGSCRAIQVMLEAGKEVERKPCSRLPGTTVEVHDLFFNAPVRKKFQKSQSAQMAAMNRLILQFALSHPSVRFVWKVQGKEILQTARNQSLKERLFLWADQWFKEAIPLFEEEAEMKVEGYLAPSFSHRAQRSGQLFFLNGRPIYSNFLARVLTEGYATRLPQGRFPQAVIHLKLPLHWVDVNVHPQKKEVRLREEDQIKGFLKKAINSALQKTEQVTIPQDFSPTIRHEPSSFVKEPSFTYEVPDTIRLPKQQPLTVEEKNETQQPLTVEMKKEKQLPIFTLTPLCVKKELLLEEVEEGWKVYHLERLYRRKIQKQLEQKRDAITSQRLLFPIELQFPKEFLVFLLENKTLLKQHGLEICSQGKKASLITLPTFLNEKSALRVLEEYAGDTEQELSSLLVNQSMKSSFTFEEGRRLVEECAHLGISIEDSGVCLIVTTRDLLEKF